MVYNPADLLRKRKEWALTLIFVERACYNETAKNSVDTDPVGADTPHMPHHDTFLSNTQQIVLCTPKHNA